MLPRRELNSFDICGYQIIRFPGGNTLGKLARVIRIYLPVRLFRVGAANLHFYSVDGLIIRVPDCSENKRVGLLLFFAARQNRGWNKRARQHADNEGSAKRKPVKRVGTARPQEKSPSSASSSASSSSSSYSSSSTDFNSIGFVVITSKSVPHSGQETTSPSSTSS